MAKKLTQISVDKLGPLKTTYTSGSKKRREIPDAGKPGLYLVIQSSGKKSWAVRYRHKRQPRKLTLNGFPSLMVARKLAQEALDRVAEGFDPAAEKKFSTTDSHLLKDVMAQFIERHVIAKTRATSARSTIRLLSKEVLPAWGERPISEITKREVIDLLDDVADRSRLSANRLLSCIRKLFNWCVERDLLAFSPATGVKPPLEESSRDRVLSDEEMQNLVKACKAVGYPAGTMTLLMLLTAQRRNEVCGMKWSELSLDGGVWTLPAERTKNGKLHPVPLSPEVVDVLKSIHRISGNEFVFPSLTGISHLSNFSRAKKQIDAALGQHLDLPRWTFHDLRRTAASGMARQGVSLPVIEKVLNHTSGSFAGIVGVYQRHDFAGEKRDALTRWAAFVTSPKT